MFPYDSQVLATLQTSPQSIDDVIAILQSIDSLCADRDGLKWFNWLYLAVTKAVGARVDSGDFTDPAWIAALDVQFAALYFDALRAQFTGAPPPGPWAIFFDRRSDDAIARIQFALAGVNAHINRDLPVAILNTGLEPIHGDSHYRDFTALNATLDSLIDAAKRELNVRLPGDSLPPVSHLEHILAAFSVAEAREAAWTNAGILWSLRGVPPIYTRTLDSLDGYAAVLAKGLLIPV
jgi:hypothetical protein